MVQGVGSEGRCARCDDGQEWINCTQLNCHQSPRSWSDDALRWRWEDEKEGKAQKIEVCCGQSPCTLHVFDTFPIGEEHSRINKRKQKHWLTKKEGWGSTRTLGGTCLLYLFSLASHWSQLPLAIRIPSQTSMTLDDETAAWFSWSETRFQTEEYLSQDPDCGRLMWGEIGNFLKF